MVSNNKESASSVNALAQQEAVSEGIEAFELPRSIITRLARSAVSEGKGLRATYRKAHVCH